MLIGLILLTIALTEFLLGLYFIFRYEKAQSTIWYGLFCIAVSIYVGANGLGYVRGGISGQVAEHVAWAGGALTAIFFLPFSFSFPVPLRSVRELLPWVFWPFIIFVPGILFTDLIIEQQAIVRFGEGYTTATGDFFWWFIVFFAAYWIWAITNIIIRMRQSDGVHRWLLRTLLTGLLLSLMVTSVFDIYMPLTRVTRFGYVGSLFTSIWLVFTGYILVAKK